MTASRPDLALPIDVQGELRLEGPAADTLTLTARGSRLRLSARAWSGLRGLGPRSLAARRRTLGSAIRALTVAGLTLDITVEGRRAFGLGAGVTPSLLARLLGLSSTDIRLSNVISLLR